MSNVICRTYIVADSTDLLAEIAQMPVLNLDDAALAQVDDMNRMEAVLRLSQRHGQGIIFTVDELGQASVRFHWLGTSSALALLSTPSDIHTLYLNLSGFDHDEDAAAA